MIRPAAPRDAPAIAALVGEAFRRYVPRIGREPAPMALDWAEAVAAGEVLALEEEGAVVGTLRLLEAPDALLLDVVAVRPDRAGRGLGRRLIARAEEEARARGLPRVRLYTNALMTESRALYARLGYVVVAEAEERGFRRVYMEKPVGP